MTTIDDLLTPPPPPPPAPESPDQPRSLDQTRATSDRVFRGSVTAIGAVVLVVTSLIGLFLGYQLIPTLHHYGLHFFTQNQWEPGLNQIGIEEAIIGTVEVAIIALAISFIISFSLSPFQLWPRPAP